MASERTPGGWPLQHSRECQPTRRKRWAHNRQTRNSSPGSAVWECPSTEPRGSPLAVQSKPKALPSARSRGMQSPRPSYLDTTGSRSARSDHLACTDTHAHSQG
eukprot:2632018-Prymnesium_polylepis.1